jgi:hypothetical protein
MYRTYLVCIFSYISCNTYLHRNGFVEILIHGNIDINILHICFMYHIHNSINFLGKFSCKGQHSVALICSFAIPFLFE